MRSGPGLAGPCHPCAGARPAGLACRAAAGAPRRAAARRAAQRAAVAGTSPPGALQSARAWEIAHRACTPRAPQQLPICQVSQPRGYADKMTSTRAARRCRRLRSAAAGWLCTFFPVRAAEPHARGANATSLVSAARPIAITGPFFAKTEDLAKQPRTSEKSRGERMRVPAAAVLRRRIEGPATLRLPMHGRGQTTDACRARRSRVRRRRLGKPE